MLGAQSFCWFCHEVAQEPRTYELPHNKTNKMAYAPSEDSDQPGHLPAQADLSLCWAHSHYVGFRAQVSHTQQLLPPKSQVNRFISMNNIFMTNSSAVVNFWKWCHYQERSIVLSQVWKHSKFARSASVLTDLRRGNNQIKCRTKIWVDDKCCQTWQSFAWFCP